MHIVSSHKWYFGYVCTSHDKFCVEFGVEKNLPCYLKHFAFLSNTYLVIGFFSALPHSSFES